MSRASANAVCMFALGVAFVPGASGCSEGSAARPDARAPAAAQKARADDSFGAHALPSNAASSSSARDPHAERSSSLDASGPSASLSPFHLFVRAFYPALYPLGDVLFASDSSDGRALAVLREGAFVRDPALATGVGYCGSWENVLVGSWPAALYLFEAFHPWSACCDEHARLFRWSGKSWDAPQKIDALELMVGPWLGATLALEVPHRSGPPWGYTLRVLAGAAPRPAPLPEPARALSPDRRCYTRLEGPAGFASFSSGEIVVLGSHECGAEQAAAVVERWGPRAATHAFVTLPVFLPGGSNRGVFAANAPDDVWFAGVPVDGEDSAPMVLVHFDGSGYRVIEPALPERSTSLAFDGTFIWQIGASGKVWRMRPGSTADPIALPPDATAPREIVAHPASGGVWVTTKNAVYGTAEPRAILTWPQDPVCSDPP